MVTSIDRYDEVDVFVGLDIGKGGHHAVALDLLQHYPSPAAMRSALPANHSPERVDMMT